MNTRTVIHDTFTIERTYEAPPQRVFAAWSTLEAKQRWARCCDDWITAAHEFDFHVGGREIVKVGPPGEPLHINETIYIDIVRDRRIVYAYTMHIGDTKLSASLVTVEFEPEKTGTRLIFTEQGAFLDGHQAPKEREQGTGTGLDNLGAMLKSEAKAA